MIVFCYTGKPIPNLFDILRIVLNISHHRCCYIIQKKLTNIVL